MGVVKEENEEEKVPQNISLSSNQSDVKKLSSSESASEKAKDKQNL